MRLASPALALLVACAARAPAPAPPPAVAPPPPAPAPAPPPPAPAPPPRAPSPTPSGPSVEGFVEAGSVLPVIDRYLPEFRACWQDAKAANPALSGRVLLRLDINDRGKVTMATLRTEPPGEIPLEACVVKRAMTLSFPPPRDGGVGIVRYPMDLGD